MTKKNILIAIAVVVVLVVVLSLFAAKPLVFCEIELPEGYLDAIKSQSKGVYASRLPLVPIYITVDGFAEGMVSYTVHYFPFGTVGMRYVAQDGYNVEKPLTGW